MLEVNEYFDGNVKSIAFHNGSLPTTVGVMAPGEYTFGTSQHETITVVSGVMTVKLPGAENWVSFEPFEVFKVAANESFDLKIDVDTAYVCTYE